jgi:hypothetical protein
MPFSRRIPILFLNSTNTLLPRNGGGFSCVSRSLPVWVLVFGLSLAWTVAPHVHAQTAVAPTAGDGLTTATAYQITELGNLVWLGERAAVNETAGKYYQLMNDIDASDTATWNDVGTSETDTLEGFRPIGTYPSTMPDKTSFRGVFNGNGKKITGLTINRPEAGYMGLFGCVGVSGGIRDLTLEEGHVTGAARVGGMAGSNTGRLIGCSSSVPVVGTGQSVGGMVGENTGGGRLTNEMASGSVTGTEQVGGLVGTNYVSTLENCSATGTVVGSGPFGGGLTGYNVGMVTNCFATGAVTADGTVGGLIGFNLSKISFCFATGPVAGNRYTGGVVGSNEGTISNSFATGSVTGYIDSGGLAGMCFGGTISNCFATGSVTGNANSRGGLVGFVLNGTITNSYWDKTTTGQVFSDGSAASFGKTTVEMKRQATFQPGSGTGATDWDFTTLWGVAEGQSYPYLLSAPPPFRLSLAYDGSGAVSPNPSGTPISLPGTHVIYPVGTTVILTAAPAVRYRFTHWTGPVADPTTVSTTVLMDAHKSVKAHFELNEYKLSVEATSGSVTLSPDQTPYTYGTVVTLTATPDSGYRFAGWTGNVADRTAASTTLVITGNMTVTARFLRSYEIRTLEELQAIATGDLTGYYTLMNDIDASATATWNDAGTSTDTLEGFRAIGGGYSNPDTTSFRGVFDGNGKKIMGLTINRPDTNCVGLFEAVGVGGEIRDLTLAGGMVAGGSGAGALVGANTQGLISNCHSSSKVSAKSGSVGGLIGSNEKGSVSNCSTSETADGEDPASVGGLIGWNSGSVVDSVATGAVKVTNTTRGSLMFKGMGGLVGANSGGTIVNSFSTGPVEGVGQYYIVGGGLAGTNNGSIRNSFASSSVKGRTISGSSGLPTLGGLVGLNTGGTVTNSFALGAIEGTFNSYPPYLGGLIGQLNGGSVSNCFSIGEVADFGTYTGGLIGCVSAGTVTACYWDIETSGQSASAGGAGAVGKYTAAMKRQATFQPEGGAGATDWDFESVWGIVEGQTYPYLRSTSEPPLLRLNVSVVGPGAVTLDPPGGAYAPGTTVTLTATAETGSHLAEWTGTVTDRAAEVTTIVLDTHKSVTARFLPCYEIRTLEELQAIATGDLTGYYLLMNDIDASITATWNDAGTTEGLLQGFRPIGTNFSTLPDTTSFRGIFDGNGKKITGLTINRPTAYYVGLFGLVREG